MLKTGEWAINWRPSGHPWCITFCKMWMVSSMLPCTLFDYKSEEIIEIHDLTSCGSVIDTSWKEILTCKVSTPSMSRREVSHDGFAILSGVLKSPQHTFLAPSLQENLQLFKISCSSNVSIMVFISATYKVTAQCERTECFLQTSLLNNPMGKVLTLT